MRIWYASIFLSLLAGKLSQIEQSAGVTQFMEIFQTQKKSDHIEKQTLNQRMCKRHKMRLSFFFFDVDSQQQQKKKKGSSKILTSPYCQLI